MRKKDDLVIEVIYLSRYTIRGSLVPHFTVPPNLYTLGYIENSY